MSTTTSVPAAAFMAAFGQADGADEIGHRRRYGRAPVDRRLVHRPAAGDEGGEAAGLQSLDRAGDEIIMQGEVRGVPAGSSSAHGAIAERRIADDERIGVGQARLGEILVADIGVRDRGA